MRRLATNEEGFTLVEMLIAMTVMAIGIAALVAGFSSGILSVNRAGTTSTAGSLADKQMESYRQAAFTSRADALQPSAGRHRRRARTDVPTGCGTRISWTCVVPGRQHDDESHRARCPGHSDEPPRQARVDRRCAQGSATGKLLFTESTTFDSSTG